MKENTPIYYIYYSYFTGDEHTGELIYSGHVTEARSDQEALSQLTKHVIQDKDGEVKRVYVIEKVSGLFKLIADSIDLECSLSEGEMCNFTEAQKHNIGFYVAHHLYGKRNDVQGIVAN